jgi:hypothetical protein
MILNPVIDTTPKHKKKSKKILCKILNRNLFRLDNDIYTQKISSISLYLYVSFIAI